MENFWGLYKLTIKTMIFKDCHLSIIKISTNTKDLHKITKISTQHLQKNPWGKDNMKIWFKNNTNQNKESTFQENKKQINSNSQMWDWSVWTGKAKRSLCFWSMQLISPCLRCKILPKIQLSSKKVPTTEWMVNLQ